MSIIRALSPVTISRIAAGEVVERPASAIKELVENSLDAGATEINISVEAAGRNLIMIQDNGSGMDKEDLDLCTERHTTSKLLSDDLLNINSFGFRGEALPSIASVSRLTIKSRTEHSDTAWCLTVAAGEKTPIMPAMMNKGTIVEVRDLFYSTPARLKFLRTERTELQHINEIIKRIALVNPQVKFTLTSDGKRVATYDANNDLVDNDIKRIEQILGKEFAENSIKVDIQKEQIELSGYISLPTYNRGTSNDIYLYINGRLVKDKILQTALRVAYQDFISSDRFPVAVLFLKIANEYVDVNVHPAKTEVRFRDIPLVRNAVISGLKNAIFEKGQKTSSTIAEDTLRYMKPSNQESLMQQRHAINRPIASSSNFSSNNFSRPKSEEIKLASHFFEPSAQNFNTADSKENSYTANNQTNAATEIAETYPLGAAVCQLHETYIISQAENKIIITDQHAAHERLIYEKMKKDILNEEIEKQRLLIPEIIEIDEYNIDKILAISEDLSKLGLNIAKCTEKSIIVHEIPHLLGECNVQKLVRDIVDDLLEFDREIGFSELLNHILATYSCHHSIRSGRRINITEMNTLLREMEETPHSGQCNHGRPTYIELKLSDIEKLFGRS